MLGRPDEFRPPAPPAFDSEQARAAIAELKTFKRTPASNHRAVYWEVFGGARAYALWNKIARLKLLEYGAAFDPPASAPNHPSYPAAHGCVTIAAATILAQVFPRDSERLLALAKEAGEARIWAGIHYRFDVEAGEALGRKVAEKVLARAFVDGGR